MEHQQWLREKMKKTVWCESVDSWYKHESGKITNPRPDSLRAFKRLLRSEPSHSFERLAPHGQSSQVNAKRYGDGIVKARANEKHIATHED